MMARAWLPTFYAVREEWCFCDAVSEASGWIVFLEWLGFIVELQLLRRDPVSTPQELEEEHLRDLESAADKRAFQVGTLDG